MGATRLDFFEVIASTIKAPAPRRRRPGDSDVIGTSTLRRVSRFCSSRTHAMTGSMNRAGSDGPRRRSSRGRTGGAHRGRLATQSVSNAETRAKIVLGLSVGEPPAPALPPTPPARNSSRREVRRGRATRDRTRRACDPAGARRADHRQSAAEIELLADMEVELVHAYSTPSTMARDAAGRRALRAGSRVSPRERSTAGKTPSPRSLRATRSPSAAALRSVYAHRGRVGHGVIARRLVDQVGALVTRADQTSADVRALATRPSGASTKSRCPAPAADARRVPSSDAVPVHAERSSESFCSSKPIDRGTRGRAGARRGA